jgi:nucleoside diphosphate kinase
MLHPNQALAFLKPHVVHHAGVVALVEELLDDAGIAIAMRRTWDAAEMRASGVVDRHYAANARTGTCLDPSLLPVDDAARQTFAEAFDVRWEDALASGRVVSGQVALDRLGLAAEELNARWAKHGARKIAGGIYVSDFADERLFVLNGFYPSLREIFTADGAMIEVMLLEFDAGHLSWKRFRDDVIGATNPAAADEHSIRGLLHDRQEDLGVVVSYRENVIHASASAFEALCEKTLWLPELPLARDPLWQALDGSGIRLDQLRAWREENPLVTLAGRTAALLDLLECLDTRPTSDRLRELVAFIAQY